MSTQLRKEREKQEREGRILEVARPMLVREGYHGLNMDRIAESLAYSKGTIYNHFSCKEEIIIALAIETTERRTYLFERAAAFQGNSRERIQAIGMAAEIFVQLYPEHFHLEQIIRSASIWEKTSEARRHVMRACELRCVGTVGGVVRDAVAQGDLVLNNDFSPEDLVFGLWSTTLGAFSIITTSDQLTDLGIRNPIHAYRENVQRLLDGFGWQPLSDDFDFEQSRERVCREIFSEEIRHVES